MKQFGGQFVFDSSTNDYDVRTIYDVIKVYEAGTTELLEIDVETFVSFKKKILTTFTLAFVFFSKTNCCVFNAVFILTLLLKLSFSILLPVCYELKT